MSLLFSIKIIMYFLCGLFVCVPLCYICHSQILCSNFPLLKVLHGGVCINPGVLTKGKVKGTFARLYFSGAVGDKSSDRFQVQVLRL